MATSNIKKFPLSGESPSKYYIVPAQFSPPKVHIFIMPVTGSQNL